MHCIDMSTVVALTHCIRDGMIDMISNHYRQYMAKVFVPCVVCREEHIQALLAVRGDASREMRQMIIGTLSENKVSYSGVTEPIFKDITVPTITMTTMTTMTSMATAKLLK